MLDPIAVAAPYVGPIERVQAVDGFVGNRTFRLSTADGDFFLKVAATAAAEARACELAWSIDVPAPVVVGYGSQFLITRCLAGHPVAAAGRRSCEPLGTGCVGSTR